MNLRCAAMQKLIQADLYGITDAPHSRGRSTMEVAASMLAAGITVIQYREKDKSQRQKFAECQILRDMTRQAGALFIVNDHPDLALLTAADGVHIGQDDYPPGEVRKLIGPDMILGLSTHAPVEAQQAQQEDVVDYIGVGPLFATRTKRDVCQPVGWDYLDYVVHNIRLPFVAIGGIKMHNIREVASRGARTIALVTEITGAGDIAVMVRNLRQQLKN
ncbi:thiamine phosphate synthase [Lucifera butyrica]|uniref:Thiamine-phosphate synthase n=1 Tax=Lucifera butyrica TaxID=1351585 RepID=A0A498R383_9FIRM|nr:thiamine phosphate synthase [Lucifera butyrica]VBB05924.1 thiamine phosphate synthase [Lucifera butyrica]